MRSLRGSGPGESSRLPRFYLQAGGFLTLTTGCEVTTVLGPCLAITLWNRVSQVAAICHAMLPDPPRETAIDRRHPRWKYVSEVVPEMLERFGDLWGTRGPFEVKLFGGADLSADGAAATIRQGIGARNVERALELLGKRSLAITASDVGGRQGRKLIFNTRTGGVRIKMMPAACRAAT